MSRYDGLIIPRSYSEYINKTDAATLQQALQLSGVLDSAPTEDSVKAVKSGGVYTALAGKQPTLTFDDVPTDGSNNPVKSNGIYDALAGKVNTSDVADTIADGNMNPVTSNAVADKFQVISGELSDTNQNLKYVKTGNVIQIHGVYADSISPGTSFIMGTILPAGKRPALVYRATLINNGADYPCGQAVINTDGIISLWVSSQMSSAQSNLEFSATFIVE